MAKEQEYRAMLHKAQASLEPMRDFLAAVKMAPIEKPEPRLALLVETAENHAQTLEHELDEIWDLLKRAM